MVIIISERAILVFFPLGKFDKFIVEWSGLLDKTCFIFLITVGLISFSVFNFRFSYISRDIFSRRFHILLLTFVFSILVLIFSNNYIRLIIGWDGLGIRSYLLVIYYGRVKSYCAGILTFLTNRVGDFFIIIRLLLVRPIISFNIAFYSATLTRDSWFILLLVRGAFTKRAQIPFRAWLPAAIAAPTPVSSLVHSSTLVTAGVYLLIRHCYYITDFNSRPLVFFIGLTTIMMARVAALNEKDIKKMIALSTLSQLGVIVISIGLCLSSLRFLHLVIHAFFKAIIFIRTGNLIHLSGGYQAIQHTGSLIYNSPINRRVSYIAVLSLIGTPFRAAYFSKEPIIEITINSSISLYICYLSVLGVILTVIYSVRFRLLTMLNNSSIRREIWRSDTSFCLNKGIYCLLLPSFLRGSFISRLILKCPSIILYSNYVKLIISLILLTVCLWVGIKEVSQLKKGEFRVFPIWNLSAFSSSVFNEGMLRCAIKLHSYRRRLINVRVVNGARGQLNWFISLESNFIFRLIRIIPIRFIIVWFLV